VQSTWTTDGEYITIVCQKENLCLYDGSKGIEADTHWHRLLTVDQYVERGMVAANYNDLPAHMKHRNKMAELKRKDKENKEKEANTCPLCGKDVRFFCECRTDDKDYERPLPQGWKDCQLGFRCRLSASPEASPEALPTHRSHAATRRPAGRSLPRHSHPTLRRVRLRSDNYDKYSLAEPSLIQERPPPQPRPYQGRVAPKYGLDGKAQNDVVPPMPMLCE
jgi:hypothetical protein